MAQRMLACTACHGKDGVATNQGYFPRIAGKPAGYLYQQLRNFRERRRNNPAMANLLENMSDAYLLEIAQYFSALDLPYPAPSTTSASAARLAAGEQLVLRGDKQRGIAACVGCHGAAMTGRLPSTPGLLGLPRDYVVAQIGAWQTGLRRATAPDCMAQVAQRLTPDDLHAVSHWLASQPVPANSHPAPEAPPTSPPCKREPQDLAQAPTTAPAPTPPTAPQIQRGAYLARSGNCQSCHTQAGGAAYAGGRGIDTPFGAVYAGNLTPAPQTGLGSWNAAQFWDALHNGRSRDGHLLYPAFPYPQFTRVTREDSDALFAYLRSLPPVERPNTPHALRFPFSTQVALAVWRALFFTPAPYQALAEKSEAWNRGRYLVQGLGHCAACHSPRNALGGSAAAAQFSGGTLRAQKWYAPSLRSRDEAGVAEWTDVEIVDLLKGGVSRHGTVSGPMAEVVYGSTQYLSEQDLGAMASYLKDLPQEAPPTATVPPASTQVVQRGAKLYEHHCANCHGEQGQGVAGVYPALAANRAVTLPQPDNLLRVVVSGGFAPVTAKNPRPYGMPPFGQALSDRELADVLTFIRQAWGNRAPEVFELEVLQAK